MALSTQNQLTLILLLMTSFPIIRNQIKICSNNTPEIKTTWRTVVVIDGMGVGIEPPVSVPAIKYSRGSGGKSV